MNSRRREVSASLEIQVHQPLEMLLQLAVCGMEPAAIDESFTVTCEGRAVPVVELAMPGEGRVHRVTPSVGRALIEYRATVTGAAREQPVSDADRVAYLRPSRYAESDRLAAVANAEFAGIAGAGALLAAVSSWVGAQLSYVPGSSGPTDGAVDTLLLRQGVCRDYAHLVIALLRSLDVPARLAAVYAPGLDPMDFHAVAEAAVDGVWRVVDATLLAPRTSLVRIATGRDAADTAFLSTYGGAVDLLSSEVVAVVDGTLPDDDVHSLVCIT
ncbi:MAG TPA: transglutaminase family protein [Jatrophihabitantaceae bacterium]|nr:transglutaminase family protein [Jatrophihabitantaceae bacterium]